ncbi:MAG TPA: hypothetical protein VMF03_13925 [Steroidobacteraceae bacterium]|nr:hypothetical protein [Steroidobacteraceae bacterium]
MSGANGGNNGATGGTDPSTARRDDSANNRQLVWATWVIAAATAAGAGVGYFQWQALRTQQKTTEALTHATLSEQPTEVAPIDRNGHFLTKEGKALPANSSDVAAWLVTPKWKNIGSTDAQGVAFAFDLLTLSPPNAADPNRGCPRRGRVDPSPTGDTIHAGEEKLVQSRVLSLADAQRAAVGQVAIYIMQYGGYSDVYGKSHHIYNCEGLVVTDLSNGQFGFPILAQDYD